MHLLVSITPHGFGHAAQVAPVLNRLYRQYPALEVTLVTRLPEGLLRERIRAPFRLIDEAADFGLIMNSALDIDLPASARAYAEMHADWDARVARQAAWMAALSPDLVLADVPYLSLAAAARAGIPAVALCSLNWADIYRHYFSDRPEAARILEQMEAAYASANAFLCPEPAMPMDFLPNRIAIGPIAARGRARRDELLERLGLGTGQKIVLVTSGGVDECFPVEQWPRGQGITWLVRESWQVRHPEACTLEDCGMPFVDLVASCDAVLGKCGYGTVSECVVNATPLLYVPRPDWPEETSLVSWLEAHRAAYPVPPAQLQDGRLAALVGKAVATPVAACEPSGAAQAAALLGDVMGEVPMPGGVRAGA